MKSQKIQEMSNEELLKRKKTTEVATGTLAGLLVVLLALAIFLFVRKEVTIAIPLLIIPLSLSSIVFINYVNLRAIRKELEARNPLL